MVVYLAIGDGGGSHLDRCDHRARVGDIPAGDIEGGAMVGRGAHDRKTERDIDAVEEMQTTPDVGDAELPRDDVSDSLAPIPENEKSG